MTHNPTATSVHSVDKGNVMSKNTLNNSLSFFNDLTVESVMLVGAEIADDPSGEHFTPKCSICDAILPEVNEREIAVNDLINHVLTHSAKETNAWAKSMDIELKMVRAWRKASAPVVEPEQAPIPEAPAPAPVEPTPAPVEETAVRIHFPTIDEQLASLDKLATLIEALTGKVNEATKETEAAITAKQQHDAYERKLDQAGDRAYQMYLNAGTMMKLTAENLRKAKLEGFLLEESEKRIKATLSTLAEIQSEITSGQPSLFLRGQARYEAKINEEKSVEDHIANVNNEADKVLRAAFDEVSDIKQRQLKQTYMDLVTGVARVEWHKQEEWMLKVIFIQALGEFKKWRAANPSKWMNEDQRSDLWSGVALNELKRYFYEDTHIDAKAEVTRYVDGKPVTRVETLRGSIMVPLADWAREVGNDLSALSDVGNKIKKERQLEKQLMWEQLVLEPDAIKTIGECQEKQYVVKSHFTNAKSTVQPEGALASAMDKAVKRNEGNAEVAEPRNANKPRKNGGINRQAMDAREIAG